MAKSRQQLTERSCVYCGHPMGQYDIICDKCGSIQRYVRGDGLKIPAERFGTCEVCGQPVPEGETRCAECAQEDTPRPIVIESPKMSTTRARKAARVGSIASGVAIIIGIVGVILLRGLGATLFGIVLGAGIAGVVVGIGALIILRRRPSDEIVIYRSVYKGED